MKTFCLILASALYTLAQSPLTNDAIVKMVKGGLSESLIISAIQSQPGAYALSVDDLIALRKQGVSDKVLVAMIGKKPNTAPSQPKPESSQAPAPGAQTGASEGGGALGAFQRRSESLDRAQQQREAAINGARPASPAANPTTAAPPAGSSAPNNTFFVKWRDPRENAFEVGAPQGWTVTGGLIRASQLETHAVIRMQSPDGKIQVFYDDPEIHPRQELDQISASIG